MHRLFVLCTACLLLAPASASLGAQIGYPPTASPYEDLRGKQAVTYGVGILAPGGDPAGVGPGTGVLLTARYELRLTDALWLQTRLGYAPSMMRSVKDPLFSDAMRNYGSSIDQYLIGDVNFGINLTGNKSWKRIVPQVHGGLGFVSTLGEGYDLGAYRFGTKLQVSYGIGARLATRGAWEAHVDLTHMFWKYKYPGDYGGNGGASDESILGRQSLSAWQGNGVVQIGVSRFFFR